MSHRRTLLAGLAGLLVSIALLAHAQPKLRVEPLEILTATGRTIHLKAEIADTEPTREQGLMFRKSVAPDSGMLFDFKTPQQVYFWMKNTLIPLDMLFIADDGRIVNIAANTTPLSETSVPSAGPVLGVLEIGGGRAAALGVTPGSLVRHRIFKPR